MNRLPASETILLVLGALTLSACHMAPAPDPAAGLGPQAKIFAPVLEEEIGELFVDSDGLWAFKTSDAARIADYSVGQLVAFTDLDDEKRHLFAVVATDVWGLRLQRLDTEPVDGKTAGTLTRVSPMAPENAVDFGFCTGSGDPAQSDCLRGGRVGTRWWLYPLDTDAQLAVSERPRVADRARPTLPIELTALVSVSALGVDVLAPETPGAWLAIPGPVTVRATRPRIVSAPGCNLASEFRDALDADWLEADFTAPTNAVEISARAYETAADALVWCDSQSSYVAVPSLYRPRLAIPGRGFSVPPILGARVIELRGSAVAATDWVARLGAAIATGDFATADFIAEQLVRRSGKSRRIDEVLVNSMMAVAAGGRPEVAARLGQYATRLEWNPENSPAWLIGMTLVENNLGNTKSAIARTAELPDLLDRLADEDLRGWVIYFWTLEEMAPRTRAGEIFDRLDGYPTLALLARAQMARRLTPEKLQALKPKMESAGAGSLYAALSGKAEPLKCHSKPCAADSYGRLWASGEVDAGSLSRVARIELRPGYHLEESAQGEDPLDRLAKIVSVYPLIDEQERQPALDAATEAGLAWVRASCADPKREVPADDAKRLRTLRREGIDAALRMEDWQSHPIDATMSWLAIRGVPAACGSTEKLLDRAIELADNIGTATTPTRFLALHVDLADPQELPRTLALAAYFAARFERGPYCARWNSALAAAFAQATRYDEAKKYTEATAQCSVADRSNIDLVNAYLNFQRTGSTSPDYAREVRERLQLIVGARITAGVECVGASAVRYEIAPWLEPDVRELVERLSFKAPAQPEELSIVTASDRLIIARDHLSDTADHLDASEPQQAARSLGFAQDAFAALEHQAGSAQTRWIDEVLFDGRAKEVANKTISFARVRPEPLKKQSLSELAAVKDSPVEYWLAHAILRGESDVVRRLVEDQEIPHRPRLCEVPRGAQRGIVLDRRDGELQTVTPDAPQQ